MFRDSHLPTVKCFLIFNVKLLALNPVKFLEPNHVAVCASTQKKANSGNAVT